jgi:Skp family chaperone for outer membrane proteins
MMSILRALPMSLLLTAAPLVAQSAPASQQGLGGPAVPGVCLLSREAIFANAKAGKAATARLQQLAEQAQAEVDTLRKPVETEVQALQAEAAKLSPEQRRTREQALAPRLKAVQDKTQHSIREIDATRAKAMARIAAALQPVIAKVYTAKNCGLLIDRNTVLGGNLNNDLTAAAVAALDGTMDTISFDREVLPAQNPAPAR